MAGSLVSKRFGLLGATTALLGLAAGIGCPDPEGMFKDFEGRTEDMRVVPEPPPVGNGIIDMTGTYTFAISTTISPEQPLMLLGRATMTIDPAAGTGVLNLSIQPVVPDPKPLAECPEPGTFVGDPIVLDGIQVSDTGAFSANFGEVHVEGCGNGISGSNIVANLQLDGITLSEFRMCGNVTGALSQPFPFESHRVEVGRGGPEPRGPRGRDHRGARGPRLQL